MNNGAAAETTQSLPASNSPEVVEALPIANHEPELLQQVLPIVDYYKILNVPKKAYDFHIQEQYVLLVQEKHPDKIGLSRAVTRTDLVNYFNIEDAYATLSNKKRREIHDNDLTRIANSAAVREYLQSNTNSANQPNAGEALINNIIDAASNADHNLLIKLLPEYKAMHQTRMEEELDKKIFNWLLRNAAYHKANEVAIALIDFGADVNHYGDIKIFGLKDGTTSIANYHLPVARKDERHKKIPGLRLEGNEDLYYYKCYFVELLMYYDNIELFKGLKDKFDYECFFISLDQEFNIANKSINISSCTAEQIKIKSEATQEPRAAFDLDLARARILLSMFCHWLYQNNFDAEIIKKKNPLRFWLEPTLTKLGHARDMFRGYDYTTTYVLKQFENAKHPGALTIPRLSMRYLVDCMMIMLSWDSSISVWKKMNKVGMLLHTDKPNTRLMFRALEWQPNISRLCMLSWFTAVAGWITLVAAGNNKDALRAGCIMLAQAFVIWGGIPLALAIIKPFTCGAYDVNFTIEDSVLAAYTNSLLLDVAQQARSKPASTHVVQNNTQAQPMLTQFNRQAPANEVTVEMTERWHTAEDVTVPAKPSVSMV